MKSNARKLKKLWNISLGFGLMEVVVSLGISVLGLTGAAVFSNHIITRAQMNFYKLAAVQINSLASENVKYSFFGLEDVRKDQTQVSTIEGLISSESWTNLCDVSSANKKIELSSLTGSNFEITVSNISTTLSTNLNTALFNDYPDLEGATTDLREFISIDGDDLEYTLDDSADTDLDGKLGGINFNTAVGSGGIASSFWNSIYLYQSGSSGNELINVEVITAYSLIPGDADADSNVEFTEPNNFFITKSKVCF